MSKLLKFLRHHLFPVLLVLALLIAEAFCDLALPSYTSEIVNTGIQQSGIEEPVPAVLSQESYFLLSSLLPSDQAGIMEHYVRSEDKSELPSSLQSISGDVQAFYLLKDLSEEELSSLESALSYPMLLCMAMSGDMQADGENADYTQNLFDGNLPIPEGADPQQFFASLNQAGKDAFLAEIYQKFDELPETILAQIGILFVQNEYENLGIDLGKISNRYILISGAKMLGLALASMACTIAVCYLASVIASSVGRELRGNVYRRVLSFSNEDIEKFSTASLITRTTNDVTNVTMAIVMLLRIVFYAPIIGAGGIVKVFGTNSGMTWILAVAVGVISLVMGIVFAVAMPKFKGMQKLVDKLNLVSREILTGLSVIRAFGTHKHEEERFDQANTALMKNGLFINRTMSLMMPLLMLLMNGITLLIVWNGGHSIDAGLLQVGDMMAFIQYTMQVIMAFLMITMVSIMLPRANVSAERIDEILSCEPSIAEPQKALPMAADQKGVVEFRDVSFHYPDGDEDVLEHISFTTRPGETTAIIGSTGSGKSTLINLIPRLYDATGGKVLVGGVEVSRQSLQSLRESIGFVPQKGLLFSGTIESNIKFSDESLSDEAMKKAASIAQATEFIESNSLGYSRSIAQGGTNVSGGQKQRLSIARALASDPDILIFDDSFSALDYRTDAALRRAIKENTDNKTVIIVAQRISTIANAEQIIVLDDGKVAGIGTHRQLLDSCDVYRQIALSQLSEEELQK